MIERRPEFACYRWILVGRHIVCRRRQCLPVQLAHVGDGTAEFFCSVMQRQTAGNGHCCIRGECIVSYGDFTVKCCSHACYTIKGIIAKARYTDRNRKGEACGIIEGLIADGGECVGQTDGCQLGVGGFPEDLSAESFCTDAGDAIANDDIGDATGIVNPRIVCVVCLIGHRSLSADGKYASGIAPCQVAAPGTIG